MNGFFSSKIPTKETIEKKIDDALKLLREAKVSEKDSSFFEGILTVRINEFKSELSKEKDNPAEKNHILRQYNRFAKALFQSMERPITTNSNIRNYHNYEYYPVHINDIEKPNPNMQQISGATLGIGIALLLTSIPVFFFNPPIAAIILAAAITCLLPSALYFVIPDSKDTSVKKAEEKIILEEGAKLMNPKVIFDVTNHDVVIDANTVNSLV